MSNSKPKIKLEPAVKHPGGLISRTASFSDKVRTEKVHKLDLQEGDTLLITIGGYIGEDDELWLPSTDDLIEAQSAWEFALEDMGVRAVVTHFLTKPTIVRKADAKILAEYEKLKEEDEDSRS